MDTQYQEATSESGSRTSTDGDFGRPQPDREQYGHTGFFPIPGNGRYSPSGDSEDIIGVEVSTTTMEFLRFLARARCQSVEFVAYEILEKQADHYREAWVLFCAGQGPSVQYDPMDTDISRELPSEVETALMDVIRGQKALLDLSKIDMGPLLEERPKAPAGRADFEADREYDDVPF
jgi:hypothetical protein